jgi:DNA polymerase III subunit gamma/tau
MAWYRQYRPKIIAELDIVQVRDSLQAMMKAGKIPQSLIFAGPKGTGKTSASRILALLLNDPKNEELVDQLYFGQDSKQKKSLTFQEPDPNSSLANKVYQGQSFLVHELDAASNRGIDDIRLLKERIALPPQGAKMAVYILDEVHMLTTEAFNAFLKILEEPPPHVVFILATTELQKLPATIISRCTLLNFHKANEEEIVASLERVLKAEKIKYQKEDLFKIAHRADGSFRDAVKNLELACQSGQLQMETLNAYLGQDNLTYIKELLSLLLAKDAKAISLIFEELRAKNYQQKDFYKDLLEFLHEDLLINLGIKEGEAFTEAKIDQFLLKELCTISLQQELPINFLALELIFLAIIDRSNEQGKKQDNTDQNNQSSSSSKKTIFNKSKKKSQFESKNINSLNGELTKDEKPRKKISSSLSAISPSELWQKLLEFVDKENFSLSALLRACRLEEVINGTARILVFYDFHKEQLEQQKYQVLLDQSCQHLLGEKLEFDFVLTKAPKVEESDLLETAKDVLI